MVCNRIYVYLLGAVLTTTLAVSCSESTPAPEKQLETFVADPATAGRISAHVGYAGEVPAPRPIVMSSAPQCALAHDEPVYDQSLLAKDGHLRNAIVYIEKGLERFAFAPPTTPAVVDQVGCLYEPHVALAMVGQPVEFLNSDAEAHNVHGFPDLLSAWNFMLSRKGAKRTVTFDRAEMGVRVGCDIHPWMRGYLGITAHPYAGVTAADGTVTLPDVPPGEYTLTAWHEKLGTESQEITVSPQGSIDVEFTFGG